MLGMQDLQGGIVGVACSTTACQDILCQQLLQHTPGGPLGPSSSEALFLLHASPGWLSFLGHCSMQ